VRYNNIMIIQKRYFSIFSILLLLTILSGCETMAKFDEVAQGDDSSSDDSSSGSSISFNGIDSITTVTDSTATISWTHVSGASSYSIFSVSGSTLTFVGVVTAPTATYSLTGLTPSTSATYRVRMMDASGDNDNNTNDVSITTNAAPNIPSGITMTSPASSPGFNDTPIFSIAGVKSGDTIKLFTDASCSTQVGSVVSTGTSASITTSSLAGGTFNFYATATGINASTCSTATASYVRNPCPTGYIAVPAMAAVNAPNDFCVMKYEAKNDGSGNAVSTDTGAPWVSINQTTAKTECTDLGANYDLISNPEWMAITRNVENVPANWTNNAIGDGCLKRGNVGGANGCTGGDSGYNGADPESGSGRNALASLTLDNGEVIWDLSGNVWEWVDWTLGGALSTDMTQAQKASQSGTPVAAWIEYTVLADFPANSPATAILPDNPSFNATEGMGRYYAGTGGGAALRGGGWYNGTSAGAFALDLSTSSSNTSSAVGFRCVFRP
jgi:hypothetical protein